MSVIPDSEYRKVYTGQSLLSAYLKGVLEENNIGSILRDDAQSAQRAGFGMIDSESVKILVRKEDVLESKRIIDAALQEHVEGIPEDVLEAMAKESAPTSTNEKEYEIKTAQRSPSQKPQRSVFNLVINGAIALYSLWRLSPLLSGETLPLWRIILSSSLLLFCSWTLISHFLKTSKN